MVYPADRIVEIREAKKFGITAEVSSVDFAAIMDRMRAHVRKSHDRIKESLEKTDDLDFYFGEARFTDDSTLDVAGRTLKGKTMFLVTGARPHLPQIQGLESVPYLTNENALQLRELPESMIIVGGGYIAVEFAHFFEAMGSRVTIIQRNKHLVSDEEPEVSQLLKELLSERMKVHTGTEAIEARKNGRDITIVARQQGKPDFEVSARSLLIATGRTSNADLLQVEKTGVKTDERGYIVVDDYFETTKKGIWSFGDAIGKKMFRHAANHEADLVWHNAEHGKKSRVNYLTIPHAVFSYPEIASVGLTENQAIKLVGKQHILVGKAKYTDVARGQAMMEDRAFAKAIVHRKSGKVLGYHIIGPQASVLIQEVVNAMAADASLWAVAKGVHIHPALSEVVLKAFGKLREPD
jgi:dihydrolipoamide dehydrogenase